MLPQRTQKIQKKSYAAKLIDTFRQHLLSAGNKLARSALHKYDACGQPVYFVQESWYNNEYVPQYNKRHGKGKGKGKDKGKSKD